MVKFPKVRSRNGNLRDFTADRRVLVLSAMALVTGSFGAGAAWVLLKLIALFTNLAYFHVLSTAPYDLAQARLGPLSILIPVAGGLIVGLMARFGSDKIRGDGIPEALEAILIGQSRIAPKVAFLKPLSSAIAIGTGGPFGAEGPIIMTGGALGSRFAQFFDLSPAERKTLLVAGAAAGMTAIFGTPVAAILLAVEALLFEWKPRSFVPVAVSAIVAIAWRPWLVGAWPLFPHTACQPCHGGGLRFAEPSASWRGCWPFPCPWRFTASKICSTSCEFTGCGGPRLAASWLALAVGPTRRSLASAMPTSMP